MVKVTGGARTLRALAAPIDYISHDGEVELVSDQGECVSADAQEEFLASWHLGLSAGQYRSKPAARSAALGIKLVHNVVLAMPAGTPPEKVLAAAKNFAREKFARHRYVMALHTHQRNPHVHLVVTAECGSEPGRLRIDKAMLREWREDFARSMRGQGIAANATSRATRGKTERAERDAAYRAKARRRSSYTLRDESPSVARSRASSPASQRIAGIDQVLSTRDVEQITGRYRCAIYRWVCPGTFPAKRSGGGRGWLRSDVAR